jgi:hypothetical protein
MAPAKLIDNFAGYNWTTVGLRRIAARHCDVAERWRFELPHAGGALRSCTIREVTGSFAVARRAGA